MVTSGVSEAAWSFPRDDTGGWSPEHLFNLNDKEHPQIPRFSYNFQPPTASAQEPVASMLIEEAGAGVEEPDLSSRESSMSIEFDFGSTEDHIMR